MLSLRACGGSCPEAQVSQTRPLRGAGRRSSFFVARGIDLKAYDIVPLGSRLAPRRPPRGSRLVGTRDLGVRPASVSEGGFGLTARPCVGGVRSQLGAAVNTRRWHFHGSSMEDTVRVRVSSAAVDSVAGRPLDNRTLLSPGLPLQSPPIGRRHLVTSVGCVLGASSPRLLPAPTHHGPLAGRGVADAGGPLSTDGARKPGVAGQPGLAVGPVAAVFADARHALWSCGQTKKVSGCRGRAVGPAALRCHLTGLRPSSGRGPGRRAQAGAPPGRGPGRGRGRQVQGEAQWTGHVGADWSGDSGAV